MKPVLVPTSDVNSETATVTSWRAPDRSQVSEADIVAEVETSKAVLEVLAPEGGHLLHGADEGSEIRLTEPVGYLFPTPEELEEYAAKADREAAGAAAATEDVRATAPAIERARELGVELASLPRDELITIKTVEAAAAAVAQSPATIDLPDPLEAPSGVERVVVIGAGLGATQVIDIFGASPSQAAVAVVDDDRDRWAKEVAGVPVVGAPQRLGELHAAGLIDAAVISISTSVPARTRLREAVAELGIPLANAIDPTARIAAEVELGAGNVICAFCHFGVGTRVGHNCFLSAYNSFDHHNVLGSDISTGPGCMTSGLVQVGDRARLGTGVFVEPHVHVGEGVQVASGAVIVTSVASHHAVKTRVVTTTVVPIRGQT